MQVPESSLAHLSEWQRDAFVLSSGTCLPQQKAEVYRAHLAQIQYAWANSEISEASAVHLFKKYAEKYSAIIDSDKLEIGLNNYADSILTLAKCQRNESDKWQSSLTTNNVLKLKSVQDMAVAGRRTQLSKSSADASVRVGNGINTSGYSAGLGNNVLRNSGYTVPHAALSDCQMPGGSANFLQKPKISAFTIANTTSVANTSSNTLINNSISMTSSLMQSNEDKDPASFSGHMFLPTTSVHSGKRKAYSALGNESSDIKPNPLVQRQLTNKEATCESGFKTAKEQLWVDQQKKYSNQPQRNPSPLYGGAKKSLGAARSRGLHGKFVPPVPRQEDVQDSNRKVYGQGNSEMNAPSDERLKNIEPKMIELIMSEIMDHGPPLNWDDIAGLEFAKTTIKEIVVWPMLRPDIFTGLRGPPKGILLFGPPGTGKTLIGKCIACQSGATFFSISASSLTSKWVGEGEKMVRALFTVARCHQPAVIFIDEIDSLLSQRGEGEHESSRRIKTEFLVQLDGATTSSDDRILVVGATNRPQEIDEAARRRLVKRLYIPLPEASARKQIVVSLMAKEHCSLAEQEVEAIVLQADGFSGADMTQLCREAALGPIRSIQLMDISTITPEQVRPIAYIDFQSAFLVVRPSVSQKDLELYENWNKTFGCGR
ncbi:hypothetical protein XENTR_v10016373 [Xenopus tropicalis]|uniref:Fidgetin-like protein 1 n=1 Tax=Xenopus tropicalis TaxID=8364 RepID=FIGL1_XENTR|eukprot:XP_012819639.1 PREDICTED: fidgetin-like protein 1 isoform X1 [Xenopus tropicalis]